MSDFLQSLNRITTVANELAVIAGQFSGRPVPAQAGMPQGQYQAPVAMAPDRTAWSQPATALPPMPRPRPEQAPQPVGLMEVLSGWASSLVSFVKRLFASGATAPAPAAAGAFTPSARPVAMADARAQLFDMMPTGQATVYGFVGVTVSRQADRIVVSAGSFGQGSVIRQNGEFYYQDRDNQPVRVSAVSSTVNERGDMRFAIMLESGKRIEAEILADGRTLTFDKYTLTLR